MSPQPSPLRGTCTGAGADRPRGPAALKPSKPRSLRRNWTSRRQEAQVSRCFSSSSRSLPVSSSRAYSGRSSANCSCVFMSSNREARPQHLQAAAYASFYCAQWLSRLLGNFRMRQSLKKRQLHGGALIGTHLLHHYAHFLDDQRTLGFVPQIRSVGDHTIFDVTLRPALPEPVNGSMPGNNRQPGSEAAAAAVESLGLTP